MKKNECYEGLVTELRFPNKGIVQVDGEETPVLVKNTLPGQKIRFQLKKAGKTRPEGNLLEVLAPSELENAEPFCPHFGECGGCSYQTMDYETQKNLKFSQVRELFEKAYSGFPLEECLSSPLEREYRNKMEFSFGDEYLGGPLSLGLHKQGSFYDILPVPECRLVTGDVRKLLSATLSFFREETIQGEKISFYHKMRHQGLLRHLLVRRGITGEILLGLVTTSAGGILSPEGERLLEKYRDALLALDLKGKLAGILHMVNDGLSDMVRADDVRVLYGRDYFYDTILNLKFRISPFSFFQTNTAGAEVLYSVVREYAGAVDGKTIFDLYSGTGTIAQALAGAAGSVVGVELVEEAVFAARENAKENGLENCKFLAGDVFSVLDSLEEKPDVIVLDPPREGTGKALKKILSYGVGEIIYISCKPTSLAGELAEFLDAGYRPVRAKCVDLFPWTRGIETVCVLGNKNRKPDDYLKVNIDVDKIHDILDQEKDEKETKEKSQSE